MNHESIKPFGKLSPKEQVALIRSKKIIQQYTTAGWSDLDTIPWWDDKSIYREKPEASVDEEDEVDIGNRQLAELNRESIKNEESFGDNDSWTGPDENPSEKDMLKAEQAAGIQHPRVTNPQMDIMNCVKDMMHEYLELEREAVEMRRTEHNQALAYRTGKPTRDSLALHFLHNQTLPGQTVNQRALIDFAYQMADQYLEVAYPQGEHLRASIINTLDRIKCQLVELQIFEPAAKIRDAQTELRDLPMSEWTKTTQENT